MREQTGDNQKRVAGKQETNEETRFSENDEADDQQSPGARCGDDARRVKPGDEREALHEGVGPVGWGVEFG